MHASTAKVIVYTTKLCPHCLRAKALLKQKGVAFEEIDLSDADERRVALVRQTNWRTVPQIFVNDTFIGGYDELRALDDRGQLDAMLAA